MENTITIVLEHTGVRIEAGVSKLCNLLCKEFDPIRRVTEDNRLVDLQFVEEGVQTVHLLLFFDKRVILGDAAKRELIHQIDLVR